MSIAFYVDNGYIFDVQHNKKFYEVFVIEKLKQFSRVLSSAHQYNGQGLIFSEIIRMNES